MLGGHGLEPVSESILDPHLLVYDETNLKWWEVAERLLAFPALVGRGPWSGWPANFSQKKEVHLNEGCGLAS